MHADETMRHTANARMILRRIGLASFQRIAPASTAATEITATALIAFVSRMATQQQVTATAGQTPRASPLATARHHNARTRSASVKDSDSLKSSVFQKAKRLCTAIESNPTTVATATTGWSRRVATRSSTPQAATYKIDWARMIQPMLRPRTQRKSG